jgi:hypothetical protein
VTILHRQFLKQLYLKERKKLFLRTYRIDFN